jgi:uncharacterized lipoprotein YmbA
MIEGRVKSPGVAVALTAMLAACQSAPTRLFMVEPIAPMSVPGAYKGPAVRVDAVQIPAALDRIEIVSEVAPGEFKVNDLDQWISPLGQGARQALTADLAARLPQGRVIFPHLEKRPGTISISVDVLAFNADRRGAKLQVSWLGISDGAQSRPYGGQMVLQTTVSGEGPASTATALSALLAQLADRIVVELLLLAPVDTSN